ncbi:MAG TPA: carbon monoxide dehydrogenase subunit G [Ktedonobacterales bacterium]
MHFEGDQTIHAPRQTVWDFLMNPDNVASCAPGFQSMQTIDEDHYKPTLAVGVGAVKATFTLDVTISERDAPTHAAVLAHGMAAGSAVDMRSGMDLSPEPDTPDATHLHWVADVTVSGTLASMGARLMEGTAHKLTNRFFDCLRQKLEASPSGQAAGAGEPAPAT